MFSLECSRNFLGIWEGVKGLLDQWPTVSAKATCAELQRQTTSACVKKKKKHEKWKSHPEKMTEKCCWCSLNSRSSLTHTISHPGANWTLMICKGSTWIMQAAATNHVKTFRTLWNPLVNPWPKTLIQASYLSLCASHCIQFLSQIHYFRCHLMPSQRITNIPPECLPTVYYVTALCAAGFVHVRTWTENIPGQPKRDRLRPSRVQM